MVSIKLDNVGLVYKLHEKLTLSAPDRRVGRPGGR
ncbi:ABC transporter ATP-binding protein, partial [Mesorhizobium sp. USDA-HM6]